MEDTLWDAVQALVSAVNLRIRNEGHSVRVTSYAVELAKACGYTGEALEHIRLGALLHDLGQIVYKDTLVEKQGAELTQEEREQIHSHTYKGVELIGTWPSLAFAAPYMLLHQEWINGSGYPNGVHGDQIPREVQIVSIADVYEAFRHARPYYHRNGLSHEETLERMKAMRGVRWDAELFDLFISISEEWAQLSTHSS